MSEHEKKSNTGLIVVAVVGLGCLIIIILLVALGAFAFFYARSNVQPPVARPLPPGRRVRTSPSRCRPRRPAPGGSAAASASSGGPPPARKTLSSWSAASWSGPPAMAGGLPPSGSATEATAADGKAGG